MLTYTTRDILKRAEQLTDFTDTPFITTAEKISLLNDSYNLIYEGLIAVDDKNFLRRISVCNGEELPPDFYKLRGVYVQGNKIKKRSSGMQSGYEIINNTIQGSFMSYELEYYPEPKTLFLRDDAQVTFESSATDFFVYNQKSGFFVSLEASRLSVRTAAGAEVVSQSDALDKCMHFANGYIDIANSLIYYYGDSSGVPFSVAVVAGNEITSDIVADADALPENTKIVLTDKSKKHFFYVDADYKVFTELGDECYTLFDDDILFCREDGLFIGRSGRKSYGFLAQDGTIEYISTPLQSFVAFYDENHIIVKEFDGTFYIVGLGYDTILSYPNNLFFSYMAYDIALSVCSVVGRDSSGLSDKADEMRGQLYDSLIEDENESYTIIDTDKRTLLGDAVW